MARRKRQKPEGHTLYWVYVYAVDGYNFDTTTQLSSAQKILSDMRGEVDAVEAFIFYGDSNGAFTNIDPAYSWYAE